MPVTFNEHCEKKDIYFCSWKWDVNMPFIDTWVLFIDGIFLKLFEK